MVECVDGKKGGSGYILAFWRDGRLFFSFLLPSFPLFSSLLFAVLLFYSHMFATHRISLFLPLWQVPEVGGVGRGYWWMEVAVQMERSC